MVFYYKPSTFYHCNHDNNNLMDFADHRLKTKASEKIDKFMKIVGHLKM